MTFCFAEPVLHRWLPAVLLALSMLVGACRNGPGTSGLNERQVKAQAMFAERCKRAGEKIHKTVENVEGLHLLKIRPTKVNFGDQFRLDDPYGADLGGDGYIESFLHDFHTPPRRAYAFVEATDPKDGQRYRYTGAKKAVRKKDLSAPGVQLEVKRNPNYDLNIYDFVLDRVPAAGAAPRYGVTYDDISTREERDYWIAGSSLKVIDVHTNEVVAERVGYMIDWAQGSRAGGRSPWLLATQQACPRFSGRHSAAQLGQTKEFVEKVLKPSTK